MSDLEREVRLGSSWRSVMESLRSDAELDHWILEGSTNDELRLREPMDLGTYYPVEVRISLVDGPAGHKLRVKASSEGRDLYYDNHMKRLVEELMSRLGPLPGDEGRPQASCPDDNDSDLELLTRLFQKGLLSEREFQLARERAVKR